MLYTLRVRPLVAGVQDYLIEADDQPEAEWRGRVVCDEKQWKFVYVQPAVLADKKSHPMPKEAVAKVTTRVGA